MEVSDIHCGKQLQVNFSPQGSVPIPCAAYLTGAAAIPGTGFFNGGVMVGKFPFASTTSYCRFTSITS